MLIHAPYSYSRISTYQQCPLKFKFKYVDKVKVPFVYSEALIKGGTLHHILEHHPEKSTHKHQEKYQSVADEFINSDVGKDLLSRESKRELDIGLTKDLEPCEYSSKEAMFRGSVDYFTMKDDYLWIVDWKSGKEKDLKWQSFDQNMWYALYFFIMYGKLDKIKITYQYIEHNNADNSVIMERQYLLNYKTSLIDNINKIENDTEFKLKESALCPYCDFQDICTR
jgi:CRISPR/Cas system-associated exonuclease Cas4 (RecB family)